MKNQYFLLRHGQTIYQTKKKKFLYPPWPATNSVCLTKKGEEQIKAVAKKLKNKEIDLIYSSDFFRTRQTAEIVVKELGLKVKFDKRLRDINIGILHGKLTKEYKDFFSTKKQRFSKRPFKGENWRDVKKRLIDFVKDIEKKHKNKTILIISHGDPLWLLFGMLKGIKEKELLEKKYEYFFPEVGQLLKT